MSDRDGQHRYNADRDELGARVALALVHWSVHVPAGDRPLWHESWRV